MTEELKKLIDTAETMTSGEFSSIMVVPNGKYAGFWGENGYDNMLVLGCMDKVWYKVADCQVDVFEIFEIERVSSFNMDIPYEYGVPRFWFCGHKIKINYDGISSCVGELVEPKGDR